MKTETSNNLYFIIGAAFSVVVVLSNILSAKMTPLPLFGITIPAGLITYPLTFLLSDLVTEIWGGKKAKLMVYTALGLSVLSYFLIQVVLLLPNENEGKTPFDSVMGLSGLRIFSSLTAYIIAQIADIQLYVWIKRITKDRFLWLRNNGSTCLSQMIDTIVVDLIFLYWGLGIGMDIVFPIMVISYIYKALFSFAITPLFYMLVFFMQGKWKTKKLDNETL